MYSKIYFFLCLIFLGACEQIEETSFIRFKADFQVPQVVRVKEPILFQASEGSTGAQSFLWKFGDAKRQSSNATLPTFAYDTIGEYTSTLVVEMNKKQGLQKDSAKQKIFVLPPTADANSGLYAQTNLGTGAGKDDIAMSFVRTTAGGFYVVAQTDLNKILVTRLKADLSGKDWQYEIDDLGASPIYPKSIIETSDRGCLITGYTEAGIGDSDAFVLKLDKDGLEEWRNTETNSSNYERYNDAIEMSNNRYLIAGSIGKNPNSAVAVLHILDAEGDYLNKMEYTSFKNFHVSRLRTFNSEYFLVGKYLEQPAVLHTSDNLFYKALSTVNIAGEANNLAQLQGGNFFLTGRGYTKGNPTLEDSTSFAFGARFDAITGAPYSWLSTAKMYRERYIDAFQPDQNTLVAVGEHYNPLSDKDLLFTKINPQNGKTTAVRLLGDLSEHRPVQTYFDGTSLYILATTRESISDKNSRYDVCIVKTTLSIF